MMNSHDIQVAVSQLTNITNLLDDSALSMNRIIGESTSLGARAHAVGRHGKNLSSPDHHGNMETCHVCLPHAHRIGVHEELGNQRVITGSDRSGHFREDVWGEYWMHGVRCGSIFQAVKEKYSLDVETMVPEQIVIDGETYKLTLVSSKNGATAPTNGSMVGGKKSKKEKKAKSTRKLSPYMKFAQEARKNIIKDHPEMKSDIIAVGKKIGEMWRGLSDSEKAKY